MIAPPEIVQTSAEPAAVIRLTIPRSEMMKQFGPAVGELMRELAAQGVAPAGALFAHHLAMSHEVYDFELGVPVAAPVAPNGRVTPGVLPAARVARTTYSGPYEGLPGAWGDFSAWIDANGHKPAAGLWEVYSVGPQASSDPANWRTELNRLLRD
jgi:effector-binding domain-containing protein